MKILAIETSCDETSAAVVEDGRRVLSNVIASQAAFHARYGGVIPEMAARQHLDVLHGVLEEALSQANCPLASIDAFAATLGPGLIGALLVGANAAKTLSFLTKKPFRGVNHLEAHVASNYLETDLAPPFVCLLVSGGHTQIRMVRDYGQVMFLGETLDDAVGEAYDKVARMLGLPYPGGPALDALAQTGNPTAISFPEPRLSHPYAFSFSGLKTAVLRTLAREASGASTGEAFNRDVAAAFQEVATEILVTRTVAAAEAQGVTTVAIAGGVAANWALRQKMQAAVQQRQEWRLFVPAATFCTDNAAMVGAAAFYAPMTEDLTAEVFSRTA